jgi:hypothetical protein
MVGSRVGSTVGSFVGGISVGEGVGFNVGLLVGKAVGDLVGSSVGDLVGASVGLLVGGGVGLFVGSRVGGYVLGDEGQGSSPWVQSFATSARAAPETPLISVLINRWRCGFSSRALQRRGIAITRDSHRCAIVVSDRYDMTI